MKFPLFTSAAALYLLQSAIVVVSASDTPHVYRRAGLLAGLLKGKKGNNPPLKATGNTHHQGPPPPYHAGPPPYHAVAPAARSSGPGFASQFAGQMGAVMAGTFAGNIGALMANKLFEKKKDPVAIPAVKPAESVKPGSKSKSETSTEHDVKKPDEPPSHYDSSQTTVTLIPEEPASHPSSNREQVNNQVHEESANHPSSQVHPENTTEFPQNQDTSFHTSNSTTETVGNTTTTTNHTHSESHLQQVAQTSNTFQLHSKDSISTSTQSISESKS